MFKSSWLGSWWWPLAFCMVVGAIYGQGIKARNASLQEVRRELALMEREIRMALKEKETLGLQLASQSDPAWLELVLLRQMGVVPEGFLKVHFKR